MRKIAPKLSLLGLSIDSSTNSINRQIGRVDPKGKLLTIEKIYSTVTDGRRINADMQFKINTVVNSLNHRDNMASTIQMFQPDRWKVLRILPVVDTDLTVTQTEFSAFVYRHRQLGHVMCVEDTSDVTESYIMVDPIGRFIQNSQQEGQGYHYSPPILECGADAAFSSLDFSASKFIARYQQIPTEVAV